MHLNLTSIEDAWGVSDISTTDTNRYTVPSVQKAHLQSHVIPQSSVIHPNSIVETRPTRMDVALYHPEVIEHLFPKNPDKRTAMVTDLIRASLLNSPNSPSPSSPNSPSPSSPNEVPTVTRKEHFEFQNDNMTILILLTLILLLVDKLLGIWKNS
jgi:hypothetical protein